MATICAGIIPIIGITDTGIADAQFRYVNVRYLR
jgi:hypothetical protein